LGRSSASANNAAAIRAGVGSFSCHLPALCKAPHIRTTRFSPRARRAQRTTNLHELPEPQ
jgi:hypothetical protein